MTPGSRRPDGTEAHELLPGEYAKIVPKEGVPYEHFHGWFVFPPSARYAGWIRSPEVHAVVEYEDGTITVTPSIMMQWGDGAHWHGYLTRGGWTEV